jgi:hypothetical protein
VNGNNLPGVWGFLFEKLKGEKGMAQVFRGPGRLFALQGQSWSEIGFGPVCIMHGSTANTYRFEIPCRPTIQVSLCAHFVGFGV